MEIAAVTEAPPRWAIIKRFVGRANDVKSPIPITGFINKWSWHHHNPLEEWRRNEAAPRRLPSVLKRFPMVSFLYSAVVFVGAYCLRPIGRRACACYPPEKLGMAATRIQMALEVPE
jgi:hypothetical protein